jgi:FtsP/CotA-like multicopper oxidase with cupredoxin domain
VIQASAAVLALGCAVLALGVITGVWGQRSHTGTSARVAEAAPAQATREFTLVAQEADWEIFPGTVVKAWTYGGTVPGPELRVTEGDLVRVTLQNTLPVPTTIHWHGVDVPWAMDGVPGLTQDAVPPGGTFTYEFTATNPGTRWYHTHQDSEIQTPLGLYGPLIIEPKTPPAGAVSYNREYTYTLSEWALAMTPDVATGEASLPLSGPGSPQSKQLDFDLFLINGKAHDSIPPIALRQGERVRVRLINAGQLVHTIHPHGHSFKIIATDGNFVPPANQLVKDSVTLGPSERVDIEIHATNPGVWMFHCHMAHHAANGMMTVLRYEDAPAPALGMGHQHEAAALPVVAAAPSAPALAAADVPGSATKVVMTDNRFGPSKVTVRPGTTVAWVNNGANLHTISDYNGKFESGSIATGKAFTFTFNEPGEYRYLCRQHLFNGMAGTITVQ